MEKKKQFEAVRFSKGTLSTDQGAFSLAGFYEER